MPVSLVLAALSAFLCALALPNEIFMAGLWPVGFIAVLPLIAALRASPTPRRAALVGAVFGTLHHCLTSYWLFFYRGFALWTLGSTALGYAVVYAVAALYGWHCLHRGNAAYRAFFFALGWTAFEYFKSTGFLGYPWGLLPYSLTSLPVFLQIADITGVYGLSFLLSYVSAAVSELFVMNVENHVMRMIFQRHLAFAILLLALTIGYGSARLATDFPVKGRLRAGLVQQNTDPWIAGEAAVLEANVRLAKKALEENSAAGGEIPNLIVFSETSFRRPYAEYRNWFKTHPKGLSLAQLLDSSGASLLTGAPVILDWDTYAATNSTLFLRPDGTLSASYAKMHPVPFAEAIPLWEYEWFRKFMRETVGLQSGWVMGDRIQLFEIQGSDNRIFRFATPICFEDAFAGLAGKYYAAGADLLVNLTNDSWSRRKSAQYQHWAIARFRAIEHRRTLVRSTNSGVSSVIDAWGINIIEFPQFEAYSQVVTIPVHYPVVATLYSRFGDWFAILCALLFALKTVITSTEEKR